MMRIDRRHASSLEAGATALPFAEGRTDGWYEDPHHRAAYERWREGEIARREAAARGEHRAWSMHEWNEHEQREAWARLQPWHH